MILRLGLCKLNLRQNSWTCKRCKQCFHSKHECTPMEARSRNREQIQKLEILCSYEMFTFIMIHVVVTSLACCFFHITLLSFCACWINKGPFGQWLCVLQCPLLEVEAVEVRVVGMTMNGIVLQFNKIVLEKKSTHTSSYFHTCLLICTLQIILPSRLLKSVMCQSRDDDNSVEPLQHKEWHSSQ